MLSAFLRSKSKQERLWDACSYGKEEDVKKLLTGGADPNWRSHTYGCCLIHIASQGKPSILLMLLKANCQIDSVDENGNTALHHAAMSGRLENVSMLLQFGISIEHGNDKGWTALHNSVYWNHPDVTQALLEKGANPFMTNKSGRNTLHELCRSKSTNQPALVDNLNAVLDSMSVLAHRDHCPTTTPATDTTTGVPENGWSSHSDWIDARCECKNTWDSEADFTPLLFAAYHSHVELVRSLLKRGANIQATTQNGWTALHWAAQRCHADIVEVLLDYGASSSVKDLRGDMPCDVTNDMGLRECLLPYSPFPDIISNGSVSTDDEDGEDGSATPTTTPKEKPHLNGYVLPNKKTAR